MELSRVRQAQPRAKKKDTKAIAVGERKEALGDIQDQRVLHFSFVDVLYLFPPALLIRKANQIARNNRKNQFDERRASWVVMNHCLLSVLSYIWIT